MVTITPHGAHSERGSQPRAAIDYERLAAADPDVPSQWRALLNGMGLDLDADDPELPDSLRALLHVRRHRPRRAAPVLMALAAAIASAWLPSDGAGVAIFAALFLAFWGGVGGFVLDALLRRFRILPPLPTRAGVRDLALEQLRAEPFVVCIGGRVVENVPALEWIADRERELQRASARCDARILEIDRVVERVAELSARLGEDGPDPQRGALLALRREEEALSERITALQDALATRRADLLESLERVRAAAELAALRERSAQLLGQGVPDARIAMDRLLDVGDLRERMDALRDDLADEESRWRAVAEVAATR